MRIIHFSDTHLGFNDLDILNKENINQREADFYDEKQTKYEEQKLIQIKKENLSDYEKIKANLVDFKVKLNSEIAPRISDIAPKMYSQITKEKYQHIEVDNDFDFYIYDDG